MSEHKDPSLRMMDWLERQRPDLFEAFWSEPSEQPHKVLNAATGLDIQPGSGIDMDAACGQWLAALKANEATA